MLNYTPEQNDPLWDAGYKFVDQHRDTADKREGNAPLWFGWMVRQAFWEGARWAREQDTLRRRCETKKGAE